MRMHRDSGFSLVEALVALALIATVSAALLPAVALASRLHRESAMQTDAALIGAAHLARLAEAVAASSIGPGGSLDGPAAGWREAVDATGAPAPANGAAFEVRSQVSGIPGGAGVMLAAVRVLPLADRDSAVTFAIVVRRA